MSILMSWEVNIGSGCGLAPSASKLLSGPLLSRFMTPYDILCLKWVQYLSYIVNIKLVDGLVLSVLRLSAGMALDKLIMNNFPSLNGKIEIHDPVENWTSFPCNISQGAGGLAGQASSPPANAACMPAPWPGKSQELFPNVTCAAKQLTF